MNVWRFTRAVLLTLLGLVLLAVLGLAMVIGYDMLFPHERVEELTNVTYPGPDEIALNAYLTKPDGNGPFPAVLMIHEFYGLREGIVRKADLLAEQGYVVLAVDAYRGKTTTIIPRAILLASTTPQDQIAADIDAGFRYLTGLAEVDAQRTGTVGFCFGGTQALQLGRRNGTLAANVIFYGSGLVTDPQEMGELGQAGPVLGIFGEEDTSIPREEVYQFKFALEERGIENTVAIYPGVGHAFVQIETITQPGAAQQAWEQMQEFLADNLQ
jgi:carboxymethylenebutenolidase